MGRQDSYQNSLAVFEKTKNERKSNQKMAKEILDLKRHEIDTIAQVEKQKIEAGIEKQRIQRESMLRFTFKHISLAWSKSSYIIDISGALFTLS